MLIIAIFTLAAQNNSIHPLYDRHSSEVAANQDGFEANHDIVQETKPKEGIHPYTTNIVGNPIRYSTERSEAFARWLLGTFTIQGDVVLDCFAGTGNLARACKALQRHCVSVEFDEECFNTCVPPIIHCPDDIGHNFFLGMISEFHKKEREQERERERERNATLAFQQHHYPMPFPTPMSPTRSTGSSWPPGLPPLPPPSWPQRIEMGRPMYPPPRTTNPPIYGVGPQGPPPYFPPHAPRPM